MSCNGSDEAAREWSQRVVAEYSSAILAHYVTDGLLRLGAPSELLRAGLRVVDDELTHSELSWKVASVAGAERRPVIHTETLASRQAGDGICSLALSVARYFCVGETVAVPLFRMLRQGATVPSARCALNAILRDEGRHRQFGWDVLDWLLSIKPHDVAEAVQIHLPGMLVDIRSAYKANPDAPPLTSELSRWGLASPSAYTQVLESALEREVMPRFGVRRIGLSAADPEWPRVGRDAEPSASSQRHES